VCCDEIPGDGNTRRPKTGAKREWGRNQAVGRWEDGYLLGGGGRRKMKGEAQDWEEVEGLEIV